MGQNKPMKVFQTLVEMWLKISILHAASVDKEYTGNIRKVLSDWLTSPWAHLLWTTLPLPGEKSERWRRRDCLRTSQSLTWERTFKCLFLLGPIQDYLLLIQGNSTFVTYPASAPILTLISNLLAYPSMKTEPWKITMRVPSAEARRASGYGWFPPMAQRGRVNFNKFLSSGWELPQLSLVTSQLMNSRTGRNRTEIK